MTQEQEQLVNDHQWIVGAVLKKLNQTQNEDLRSEGLLLLCELSIKFDNSKGVKFSTYAYNQVYFRIIHKLQDYQTIYIELNETMAYENPESKMLDKIFLDSIESGLKGQQKALFQCLRKGMKPNEIKQQLNKSYTWIEQTRKEIIEGAKK